MLEDFYNDVLPPKQSVLVATLKGKSFKIYSLKSSKEIIPFLSKHSTRSTYHALGGYKGISIGEFKNEYDAKGNKTAGALDDLPEASRVKAWGFDLDVGDKPNQYKNLKEATDTLAALISSGALPEPRWVVRTGGGLQFYLVLGGPGAPEKAWTAIFSRLKVRLNTLFDGKIDSNVGSTAHSWLRSPCTPNVKYDPPRMPKIVHKGPTITVEALKSFIASVTPEAPAKKHEKSNVQVSHRISSKVLYESCAAMRYHKDTGGEAALEPEWAAIANIAAHTLDPYTVFHDCSKGHPDYDEDVAEAKYNHIAASASAGPWGCGNFGNKDDENSPCHGCWVHEQPGIKNPISAARAWEKHGGPPEERVPLPPCENGDPNDLEGYPWTPAQSSIGMQRYWVLDGELWHGQEGDALKSKHVGTFLLVEAAQFNSEEKRGTCFIGRPGGKKFPVETAKLGTAQSCSSSLTQLTFRVKEATLMQNYLQGMALNGRVVTECVSYGWLHDFTSFFGVNGRIAGPKMHPSEEVIQVGARWQGEAGDAASWVDTLGIYDKASQRPYLMSLLASLACPLLKYLDMQKGVILTITGDPGAGKSSSTRVANSVWGKPLEQLVSFQSSYVSIRKAIGICNHLPVTIDEHTSIDSDILKSLALEISQGEGRTTLTQARKLRQAESWHTVLITTGNSSYHEKLAEIPNTSGADMTRVMEIMVEVSPDVPMQMGDQMVKALEYNHGTFGPLFINHILTKDQKEERQWIKKVVEQMVNIDGLSGQDRFMRDLVAACYMAHRYAKQINPAFPGEPSEMFEWMRTQLAVNKQRIFDVLTSRIPSADDFLIEFESEGNILIDKGDGITSRISSIKGYCYQKGSLVYAPKALVEFWASKRGIPYRTIVENWRRADRLLNMGTAAQPRYSAICPEPLMINGKAARPHVLAITRSMEESNDSERPTNVRDIKRARARKAGKALTFDIEGLQEQE